LIWGLDSIPANRSDLPVVFGWRRGSFINGLRRGRGLPPMPDLEPSADLLRERYAREQRTRDRTGPPG
jgi:hypothetical protein